MAVPPPKIYYDTEEEYRNHYLDKYCKSGVLTHDNIQVKFNIDRFYHAFYERPPRDSSAPKKELCLPRARRVDWIEEALTNPGYPMYKGWLPNQKDYTSERRVALFNKEYIVVIRFYIVSGELRGKFVTAYSPHKSKIKAIESSPLWTEYKKNGH